jgi:hypothetical protein
MTFRPSFIAAALMLASATFSHAQFDPGQWVGDLYFVRTEVESKSGSTEKHRYFIDKNNKVADPTNYGDAIFAFWLDDGYENALYTTTAELKQDKEGLWRESLFYKKWQDGEWVTLGEYRSPKTYKDRADFRVGVGDLAFIRALPCENNRFIAVSWADLVNDQRPDRTPFAVMKVNPTKKEISVDRSIDYGIDELKDKLSDQKVFSLPANAHYMVAGKYGVIINTNTGLFWSFNLEKASLVKAGTIFKNIEPKEILDAIHKGGWMMAVLGCNPEKEGTVLISALEDAALKNGDKWNDLREVMDQNPSLTEKEREKLFLEQQKKMERGSRWVVWYRLYPENGRVEKLDVPPNGASVEKAGLWSTVTKFENWYRANEWRPMPDGSVKMGILNPKPPEEKGKTEKDKK